MSNQKFNVLVLEKREVRYKKQIRDLESENRELSMRCRDLECELSNYKDRIDSDTKGGYR